MKDEKVIELLLRKGVAMSDTQAQRTVHHIRESVIPLSLQIFTALFIINGLYAVILATFLLEGTAISTNPEISIVFLWVLHSVSFVLQVIAVLRLTLTWATTNYYVTGKHLIRTKGIMIADEDVYDLNSLRSVHIHESWLGRLFNFGDIHLLVAASGYREEVKIDGIANPREYERYFRNHLQDAKQPVTNDEIEIHNPPRIE